MLGMAADSGCRDDEQTRMLTSEGLLSAIAIIFFTLWCFQWNFHLLAILYGKWKFHWRRPVSALEDRLVTEVPWPGVSILKPLTGIDPNLYHNLESFFTMKYPKYELLFCVAEVIDPAIMVVQSLLQKYPHVEARLFIGAKNVGVNPKINNMIQGYVAAKHDLILISDSGLRMQEDTLVDMVSELNDQVGLVHQLPFVSDKEGFASVLEKVYFGTQHAKMYLSFALLGVTCVTGMSCLFRRQVLEEAGGLKSLSPYLAEDYYLARVFADRGWLIRISCQPAWQNAGNSTVDSFQTRMKRWAKLRTVLIPSTILLEPITECLVLGLLGSWSAFTLLHVRPLIFFSTHVTLWLLLDYVVLRVIQRGNVSFHIFQYMMAWLFRESTSLYLILKAHCDPYLTWRGKKYIIKWGGVGEEAHFKLSS